jgi:hypothetical protein
MFDHAQYNPFAPLGLLQGAALESIGADWLVKPMPADEIAGGVKSLFSATLRNGGC